MSGGSHNYVCHIYGADEVGNKLSDLQHMADDLAARGFPDAARETNALILDWRAYEARTDATVKRLRDVWKAVEWHASFDWGPERVDEAIAKYRGAAS